MVDEPAEALQRAAVELIGAARSFLDAAEAAVRDPSVVTGVATSVGSWMRSLADLAASAAASAATAASAAGSPGHPGPAGGERVQSIDLDLD